MKLSFTCVIRYEEQLVDRTQDFVSLYLLSDKFQSRYGSLPLHVSTVHLFGV